MLRIQASRLPARRTTLAFLLALGTAAAGAATAASLTRVERRANARLRASLTIPEELRLSTDPLARAAWGVLEIRFGDPARGAAVLAELPEDDCLKRSRLAEILGTEPCAERPPRELAPLDRGAAAGCLLVPRRPEERPDTFLARLIGDAVRACGDAGELRLEATTDRFRVGDRVLLEGLWYLEDRVLVSAHPGPGVHPDEARDVLARLAEIRKLTPTGRPAPEGPEPPRPAEGSVVRPGGPELRPTDALGWRLLVPSAWARREDAAGRVVFQAGEGIASPGLELVAGGCGGKRRGSPIARRRRDGGLACLPADGTIEEARPVSLPEGATAQLVTWKTERGQARRALVRSLESRGRQAVLLVHLGGSGETGFDLEAALNVAASPEPASR